MQVAMFSTEVKQDKRTDVRGSLQVAYTQLLDEVNLILNERQASAHELYELLIYKRYLRAGFFNEFQKFVRWAIRQGLIEKSKLIARDVKGVRLPNRFTKDQLVTYFQTVDDPRIAVASFVALWAGLRIGDVISLKVEDFDFERETLRVVQSKRSKDRITPFLREGMIVVENWIKYSGATDYLFPSFESHSMATVNKQHVSSKTISNGFNKVLTKANLQRVDERYNSQRKRKKFTFHTFRHTFCTRHLENDVSPALVSRAAGHTKIDTTVNVYGHMSTGNIVRAFRQSYEKGRLKRAETYTKREHKQLKQHSETSNTTRNSGISC